MKKEPQRVPAKKGSVPEQSSPQKKESFLSWILPWKGDSPGIVVQKILLFLCLAVFLTSGGLLLNEYVIKPGVVANDNDEIASLYHEFKDISKTPQNGGESQEVGDPLRDASGKLLKFVKLQEVNPDILGWISVPNTVIDLPVLQSGASDPEFYLYRNYKKESSFAGSAFLDSRCNLQDRSLIIFGHSLNSGLMFTDLLKYKELDFYKTAPVITFDTVEDENKWKIFSVFITNTKQEHGKPFDYLRVTFSDNSDFMNFVYQLRIRSILDLPVDCGPQDQILILSTCSYEYDGYRLVVAARKVRQGESEEVELDQAQYSKNTLYPDNYRKDKGISKPNWPETYEEAKILGLLNWRAGGIEE